VSFSDDPLAVLARGVPRDGSSIEKTFWIEATENEIAVETTQGLLGLRKVGFELTMSSSCHQVAAGRVVSYSDGEKTIVDVAEHHLEHGGRRLIVTHHRSATRPAGPERT
jgi:hypothetical protein